MNNKWKKLTTILSILVILSSCQKPADKTKNNENLGQPEKVTISANDRMNAEELVSSAEQLLSPTTFMLSYRLTQMALAKDPENIKAQFYNKLLARFEAFRGVYTRIRPSLTQQQLSELNQSLQKIPKSPLKSFLTQEGGTPLNGLKGLQDVYGQYLTAVADFYKFLKEKEDSQFEIQLNPFIFHQEILKDISRNCVLIEDSPNNVTVECDASEAATKKLNISDLISLRQITAGEMLYGILFNSYSLEGAEKINTKNMTVKQTIDFLLAQENFGKLNQYQLITQLKTIGSDFSTALTWALQYKDRVCPAQTNGQRPGYLFRNGICIRNEQESRNIVQQLNLALQGVISLQIKNTSLQQVNVNVFNWSTTPIQDLRLIAPTEYAEGDNKVLSLKDNTLGGIFVDNNFNLILRDSK